MARVYSIPFKALAISAVQDLFAVTTGASLEAVVKEITLDPCATSVQEGQISFHLFTGAYTPGASGSSATIAKCDQGDASASFTCKLQNTVQTTGGTNVVLRAATWQLVNGYIWQPQAPSDTYRVPVSGCFVVSLDTGLTGITVSGNMLVYEGTL